jgi:hypothetical protein
LITFVANSLYLDTPNLTRRSSPQSEVFFLQELFVVLTHLTICYQEKHLMSVLNEKLANLDYKKQKYLLRVLDKLEKGEIDPRISVSIDSVSFVRFILVLF